MTNNAADPCRYYLAIILAIDFSGQKMCDDLSSFTSNDDENTLIHFDEWLCHGKKPCKFIAMGHAIFS
ncbi:MAG: hypothetical protein HRU78_02850 [Gammaproteobacteria bacterium]|nr:MAG: hypothetical protein HRU78_02850 [Gammaproteobacteria bacterium]